MLTESDIASLNPLFEKSTPAEVVRWAQGEFGNRLVMSSSFGADSAVLLHLATRAMPDIPVIMVDTGFLFPETEQFMETLKQRMGLQVRIYRSRQEPAAYLKQAGETDPQQRRDIAGCCAINKNEPFDRAMGELAPAAWLRGIRRGQSVSRADRQFVEYSPRYGCWVVSPLLNWGGREIHQYLKEYDLPYHPLRDQGYRSIGCHPLSCTRPIMPGEEERSGRWTGTGKLECGINLNTVEKPKA